MAENVGKDSTEVMVPSCFRGLPVLLVEHDVTSLTSLSSVLELFSYNVTSVEMARRALSMIEEEPKRFKLIITNIEMPDIDTDSFLNSLFETGIPLMLMSSEMTTAKASEFLARGASLCLEKPVSVTDIKYLWQHTIDKEEGEAKIANQPEKTVKDPTKNVETLVKNPQTHCTEADRKGKKVMSEENVKKKYLEDGQVEAFRRIVRMQRPGQSSLLGKRPIISNVPRKRCGIWNAELHMKFTAALCALGEKNATPKSILKIMNVSNLTQRQVASHLQKFKAQVQRLSETTPRTEWKTTEKTFKYPSNYEYPFKASNLTQSLIASNSSWYALALKNSKPELPKQSTSSSLKKCSKIPSSSPSSSPPSPSPSPSPSSADETTKGKFEFCLGGKVNLNKLPLFTEMMKNKPSFQFCSSPQDTTTSVPPPMAVNTNVSAPCDPIPSDTSYNPCHVLETGTNQTGLVSAGANQNPYIPEVGPQQAGLVTPEENCYVPNVDVFPSISDYVLDNDFSQMGLDPSDATFNPSAYQALPGDDYVLQTDVNQMDSVPWVESFLLSDDMIPGLVSCEESYLPPDNMMPPETYINQTGLGPCEEMYVPDLEDMFPSATIYHPESAMASMDSALNTTPTVQDCSVTQAEGSASPHQNFSDITQFLNLSDIDEVEGVLPVEEIQDLDEFLGLVDKFMMDNDAP
ncbi:PREDICTED: putative two-component response regulator-like APRR6 [Tarenaya hassleriana]|uniref:putative two-component response regulator-like APRR6 n=1 Tax=Tarenaya hassleriana TaxID=28532 RepID=UPI0008FD5B5D|nr:PREDICTED: putative two-component response regulator-like APRR6 [Tarenaya hassleriana]